VHFPVSKITSYLRRTTVFSLYCCWFLLAGCVSFDGENKGMHNKGQSLDQIVSSLPAVTFEAYQVKPAASDVIAAYELIQGEIENAGERHSIGKRLADLEMRIGESRDIEGEIDPYQAAIKLYLALLESAAVEELDLVYYQLARAYDLSGNTAATRSYLDKLLTEYPDSVYVIEAYFRRAELQFSAGFYKAAAADYQTVVMHGHDSPYARNALYMRGWSLFKSSSLDAALPVFFELLEQILEVSEKSTRDAELLDDTMRVVVNSLVYLEGGRTLAKHMSLLGNPDWQYMVYQNLAEDYRDKERFLDSVASLQTFIDHNALNALSPAFHQQMIDTLVEADFPSELLPKKKEFVELYGIRSSFWVLHSDEVRQQYSQPLEIYLFELAQNAHAEAQISGLTNAYVEAAGWYEQIMETYPHHARFAEVLFLSGETYSDGQHTEAAVAAYQGVVWEYPESEYANEAAYAAVLGLKQLVVNAESTVSSSDWQNREIAAQIEFALLFPDDLRAPGVQADAANTLFSVARYAEAADLANRLLLVPDLESAIRTNALLVVGHSKFELLAFADAELTYRKLPVQNADVSERILASIYKQGELAELSGESEAAIAHFLRAHEESPGSNLSIKALHDAILIYESMQKWDLAAFHLSRFKTLYPRHELSSGVSQRLATYYEQSGRWVDAARELLVLADTISQASAVQAQSMELARVSKYRAAELFLRAEDYPRAIQHFRDYAHQYKLPKALNLEAIHHMDLLYQRSGAADKRRFWLRKKMQLHAGLTAADKALYARATVLAAEAQHVFAMDVRKTYRQIPLNLPLKRSLKLKQRALLESVAAFEKLAGYKVLEYSSAATFEIAELYAALSSALFDSERPEGLTALELDQYELLLEEQAYPFEEQAISLHEINQRRSWEGQYDEWVRKSFESLAKLMPGRYGKQEQKVAYIDVLY